ncbi:metallophosphoesterase family protein [Coprothermobacter platensis]|uniref:metallophosphoesterase family protein n=1 Tax=Coprothermobacter platensis TaxID=108819 RepID=UPI0003775ED3|nr:metallophosphoesterase [Coprothermobacter platensis]
MRVLVTGDWHLGAVTWRRKPQDRTPEIQACLEEILDYLREEPVDLIAVTGDLTHYWVPLEGEKQHWLMDYLYKLSDFAPVIGVLGNHDWKGLVSFDKFARIKNVFIVDKLEQLNLDVGGEKVCITALPYFDARKIITPTDTNTREVMNDAVQSVLDEISPRNCSGDSTYRFLLTHGVVEGMSYSKFGTNEVPIPRVLLSQFDFTFLGHIHDAKLITDNHTQKILGCYPGGVAKLDFGEESSQQGFYIVDFSGQGTKTYFHPFISQKKLKQVTVIGSPSPKVVSDLTTFQGYVKVTLQEGDLVAVQRLYELPSVVSVELESVTADDTENSRVKFSSMEEAYGQYLEKQELKSELRDKLLEKFSSYLQKAREDDTL